MVDDFFDVGGSEEELINLIQLVEKYVSFSHLFLVSVGSIIGQQFLLVLLVLVSCFWHEGLKFSCIWASGGM